MLDPLRTALPLLLLLAASVPSQDVSRTRPFVSGTSGYHTFRIPALLRAADGTVLAFAEGRVNGGGDAGDIDLVLRRSADGGRTWLPLQVVQEEGAETIGNPAPVLDRDTGRVWLLFCRNNDRVFETHSDDHGASWSARRELTSTVKRAGWGWYATGPVHGIQLRRGPHAGRLVIPCDHRDPAHKSHVVYSDDHGQSWFVGGVVGGTGAMRPNECTAVELTDGRVALNMRDQSGSVDRRIVAYSQDGGSSFGVPFHDAALPDPTVQAATLRLEATDQGDDRDWILFSNPASATDRVLLTIRSSFDETRSWPLARTLWAGPSAYSDLALAADGAVLCLFEGGVQRRYEYIECARFDRSWLLAGLPRDLAAHEGFEAAGSRSNLEGAAGGLGFAGPWRASPGARLAARWPLDGDAVDASSRGRDGNVVGASFDSDVPAPLGSGRSLRLAGGGAHVDLSAHVAAFAGQHVGTLAAWFKTSGTGAHVLLAASDSGDASSELRLFVEGGTLRFDVRGDAPDTGQLVSAQRVNDGTWHHAAVSVDLHGRARLYLDGEQVDGRVEPWFAGVSGLDRMALGRNVDSGGPQWFFDGWLDEVVLVEQALDAAAIRGLANGRPASEFTASLAEPLGVGTATGSLDSAAFRQLGLGAVGDRIAEAGGATATRPLAASIDGGATGTFHVAALCRLATGAAGAAVVLDGVDGAACRFGVAPDGRFAVGAGGDLVAGPVVATPDTVWLLVARITQRADRLLDVRLKAYAPGESVDLDPDSLAGVGAGAGRWTAEALAVAPEAALVDHLSLRCGVGGNVEFDELRIGGTWNDVLGSASRRRRVGLGCPFPPVPADLWSRETPFPGNSAFRLDLVGALPGAACSLLAGFALAPQPIPLPLAVGCFVYAQPPLVDAGFGVAAPPTGLVTFPLPIPGRRELIGRELPLQVAAIDPQGQGLALSNGLVLEF